MNTVLANVLERQRVLTPGGEEKTLHSSIDEEEVLFISQLIQDFRCKRSLEVGCAMGVSSLAICDAIAKNSPAAVHTIIDPYQTTDWNNIGVHQLSRAGLTNFQIIEKPSEFVLPQLVLENYRIDFAFIDGWHTFDHTLIDFFYINRLMQIGGILVVDDVQMPAVKKVMRMISTYPSFRMLGRVKINLSGRAKVLQRIKTCMKPVLKLVGRRIAGELFEASVIRSDKELWLDSSVVAFQKIGEDNRPWNWFERF
jgi:predicted O-methyltransferase YrrM